jgi:hypothetical protein
MLNRLAVAAAVIVLAAAPASAQPTMQTAFPHKDGPLSATMVFISAESVSEFDKPSDQAPRIVILKDAKVGDAVAVKIVFAGPQLDAARRIDTTYDIRLLAPDGKVYDGAEAKGLAAIQAGPLPAGAETGVFDNRMHTFAMRFEPQDLPGIYRAEAILHDNVGNRHIPLTAQINLQK